MQPPPSTSLKYMLLAVSVALGLAVAGILVAGRWRAPLRADEVAAFLERTAGSGKYTFANVRIKNLMLGGEEGGSTLLQPEGTKLSIYEAAMPVSQTIMFGTGVGQRSP